MATLKLDVKNCSACGEDHIIKVTRMLSPITIEGVTYGYSGKCERSGKVVYARFDQNKEPEILFK